MFQIILGIVLRASVHGLAAADGVGESGVVFRRISTLNSRRQRRHFASR